MIEKTFVKVYETDLEFCYLHLLVYFFHVDLRIFMECIDLRKKG
jgi:hypothetical protein